MTQNELPNISVLHTTIDTDLTKRFLWFRVRKCHSSAWHWVSMSTFPNTRALSQSISGRI